MATTKQKKYASLKLSGMNQTDAIIKAGYSVKGRKQASSLAVAVNKSKAMQKLLNRSGISDEKIAQRMNEALDAEKSFFDKDGGLIATLPDHLIRLKTAELYFKVVGIIGGGNKSEGQSAPPNIKVQFVKMDSTGKERIIKTIRP